jgi:pilus assembly protein CpaE
MQPEQKNTYYSEAYHEGPMQVDSVLNVNRDVSDIMPLPRISIQAFCENAEVIESIQDAATDRRMNKTHIKVHPGGILAAIDFYETAPTPNLVILETSISSSVLLKELDRLANVCDPGTKVIVIGHKNDIVLYRELVRKGVSEYIVWPVQPLEILHAISELYNEPDTDPIGRTVAFIGARGGVGSSTLAHNVAWSISNLFSTDTVIADMDLSFGTANLDFNQDPAQGIADALHAGDRLDNVLLDRILSKCSEKLSLLASPSTLDKTIDYEENSFEGVLELLRKTVPVTVIDLPDIWTSWVKKTLIEADDIVITAAPDLASLRNAKNLFDFLKASRPNDQIPYLILNKVNTPKRREISVMDFETALNVQPVAQIPFDAEAFGNAANNGQMLAETKARSELVDVFDLLAQLVTGRAELKKTKKSALSPFLNKILPGMRA